ncbi:Cof-type HAD-IIB family hydrolase [Aerococcus sanguinicola]|uniref:Cof-type HAD-IIB family hydrolase n=1 Tax=unclassified Aerococcus TaxID=2618060 RepID=UPI0008A15F1E|nr:MULTISPECIES: Cof-type HAD-IIB family hydrolase [unclassified Aerococcus]KAB0646824.1 Cof-type HAD-IIB family hydrolase [Aerococcus sanguinicola]MDK6234128.1 Cof-type HAD-IIB family hydrolase [Aerococcus sp. UMB10185]MDK6855445.1 Cof-type HAD-IIB family hydrolase [Aerococcus sp. UMB7533]OFN00449.1 haloacid dehalogenase [Aerococcus sp. HMSC062A02]OHO45985.1 haloacid dehalogenase [Aerococcus sp. HMSC035B07]
MIQLIASDMDGTLLNGNMEIPQANIDAIMHTYSLGIPFIVCTGRNFEEAKIVLNEAGIRCPIIGLNGAIAFDRDGTVDYEIPLADKESLAILDRGRELGYYMEAMTSKNVYSSSRTQRIQGITRLIQQMNVGMSQEEAETRATQSTEVTNIDYRDDLRDLINKEGQKIVKITFTHQDPDRHLVPLKKEFLQKFDDIYVTSSFKYNIEISQTHANKGAALKRYCQEHGYDLDHVLAIGDNYNDIPMLEIAGHSFAMENAVDAVKETAKYQARSNNAAGLAGAIQEILDREKEG